MDKIYNDSTYLKNNPTWHEEDSPWKARHIQNILKKNNISPNQVCEIGCGAGEILNQLHRTSPSSTQFYGFEQSKVAFQICKVKTKERLEFQNIDPLSDSQKKFDVALVIDVFEHVEDYVGFLKKVKNLAQYKVFHIPLELSVQSVLRSVPLLESTEQMGHLHFFTKELALDVLKRSGYEIIDSYFTNGAFDHPKKLRTKILNIPRRMLYKINPDLCSRIFGGFSLMVLSK